MKYFILFYCLFYSVASWSQQGVRTMISVNDAWQFTRDSFSISGSWKSSAVKWQVVNLPHTWNADEVMDDVAGYYRGIGWYRKKMAVSDHLKNKQVFLYFEGANQVTEVFINGNKAGEHIGGYTGFCIPVSKFLLFDGKENLNEIVVKLDNSHNPNIPPLSADFTFYGGMYRDVYLMAVDPVHFSITGGAVQGVLISTPSVNEKNAAIHIKGSVTNATASKKNLKVSTQVFDKHRNKIAQVISKLTVLTGDHSFEQDIKSIGNPKLWSPEDPYLYSVVTTISDAASGEQLDEVTNPLGFRWFQFDADKGFLLNGHPYKLVGASRHQDFKQKGNALPDEMAWNDLALLKKMGGNFLRIAHYPQDPSILEACDQLGILTSVEIPVVNEITESDSFYRNCQQMLVEMVRQNYNHPSIVLWCYMNEILLRPRFNDDNERQVLYYRNILQLAKDLDSISRKEDPFRFTMIANHGDFDRYNKTGLTSVPGIIGWNLYQGWYGGQLADFSSFLDKHHQSLPGCPFLISEYGADADPRIRSFNPVKFDKSVEYATDFHQFYLEAINKRPFVAGAIVWNLADFNSEGREESMPHINNKGLLTWDRKAKDPYYFYQAKLAKQPFIKITSGDWKLRTGISDSTALVCKQPVQVASNMDSVIFMLNGIFISAQKVVNGLCSCLVPFQNGVNILEVQGVQDGMRCSDRADLDFKLLPWNLKDKSLPFTGINILLGATRYFIDEEKQQTWIPDQTYQPGSWGCVGGKPFKMAGNNRLPYGTEKNILGTDNDPVYQTQQIGIQQYRLDVPYGEYEVTLHFAELQGAQMKPLVYNLTQNEATENSDERIFHVLVNDVMVMDNLNLAKQYGVARAVAKKVKVSVRDQSGIIIRFNAVKGEPVLNALQVKRIY
ncbi:malectin domain-containing carbohydrate-binding protein [Chitinophagaceae bacterium LB-8]|uniref:Malectin domain-containing carbohydrate-binding protein n=1 Tax=Paraflavisolibacter caeni TaxID=2982496 RepID=A0A9X3BHR2_9BACT|nr:glycoside hydrolase family 2 TIM barrel-domain containing protein [Paraflavisolibacter caeni]MCU7552759.1 malectin domain-containing carbohydrate-binding protein [Paraflavisolibacter caeni]